MNALTRLAVRIARPHVVWCSSCFGTGIVLSFVDDDGEESTEECDDCLGVGHWNDKTQQPVSGPCGYYWCVECNPTNGVAA